MAEKKRVKFKRGSAPYQTGEVAGISADRADRLIKAGIAEEAKRGSKAPKKPAANKMEEGDTEQKG